MKTIKTADLTGLALDWAVASIEGYTHLRFRREPPLIGAWIMDPPRKMYGPVLLADISASADWAQGGPIIERESMHVDCLRKADHYREAVWEAWPYASTKFIQQGPTPLIAAMRCYVMSKLGGEVQIPEELT